MALGAILLGIINIALVVAVLLLIGVLILWFCRWLLNIIIPDMVQKLYLAIVGLVALYMLVALLLGIPTLRIIA